MLEKLKKLPTRIKTYVQEHPTEIAWYAGIIVMGTANLAVDHMLRKNRIQKWDAADALTLDLYGPDARTIMTREGQFGAVWPNPDYTVVE